MGQDEDDDDDYDIDDEDWTIFQRACMCISTRGFHYYDYAQTTTNDDTPTSVMCNPEN